MKDDNTYLQALLLQNSELFFKAFVDYLTKQGLVLVSTAAPTEGLINTAEAARLLGGIDRHALYNLVDQGKLAVLENLGKGHKFSKEDINHFIKQNLKYKK